jgi:hypothetical protein
MTVGAALILSLRKKSYQGRKRMLKTKFVNSE